MVRAIRFQDPGAIDHVTARGDGGRTVSETDDVEVAAVLTYVHNDFGNKATAVRPGQVAAIRAATASRKSFYIAEGLLKEHPLK